MVIRNKTAKRLSVRIPHWVSRSAVQVKVTQAPVDFNWLDNCLILKSIKPGDVITITFPMLTHVETYSLKWRTTEFWQEKTDPGDSWSNTSPTLYTLTFKGNTLVDVSPRDQGPGIPLYQRNAERDGTVAPMKTVTRFVSAIWQARAF